MVHEVHPINYTCVCISTLVYVFLAVADDDTFVRRINAFTMQVIVERVGGYVTDGADGRWRLYGQNVIGQRVRDIIDLARTEERDCAMPSSQGRVAGSPVGANVYDDEADGGTVLAPENHYWEF